MNFADKIKEAGSRYKPASYEDEINVSRELLQYCIINSLSKSGFFNNAAFLGGTSLRLFYGLDRYSEDLDFSVIKQTKDFDFAPFLSFVEEDLSKNGIKIETKNKSREDLPVKRAFIKDNSIAQLLDFKWASRRTDTPQKITVKLEIDTNPPAGAYLKSKIISFPDKQNVVLYDESSAFAGKCHALLTRKYTKGRDWYDFLFYVANKIPPNRQLLTNALIQTNDYIYDDEVISPKHLIQMLNNKIETLNMDEILEDLNGFISFEKIKVIRDFDKTIFYNATNNLEKQLNGLKIDHTKGRIITRGE